MFPVQLNTPPVLPLSGLSTLQLLLSHPWILCRLGRIWCMPGACTARDVLLHRTVPSCWAVGRAGTSYFSEMERLPETLGGLEMCCREVKLILGILVEEMQHIQKTLQRGWLWVNFMTPNLFGKVDKTHSMKSPEVVYPRGPNRNSRLKWINCYILADNLLSYIHFNMWLLESGKSDTSLQNDPREPVELGIHRASDKLIELTTKS